MMMKQVELRQGAKVLRGWVNERGTNGVPVTVGGSVEVPSEGGRWNIEKVFDFGLTPKEVKAQADKARGPFTSLKSYRGNK